MQYATIKAIHRCHMVPICGTSIRSDKFQPALSTIWSIRLTWVSVDIGVKHTTNKRKDIKHVIDNDVLQGYCLIKIEHNMISSNYRPQSSIHFRWLLLVPLKSNMFSNIGKHFQSFSIGFQTFSNPLQMNFVSQKCCNMCCKIHER